MIRRILTLSVLFIPLCLVAQESPVRISKLSAKAIPDKKQVIVSYKVKSQSDAQLEALLLLQYADGKTIELPANVLKGHYGVLQKTSGRKKLVWSYPDSISSISQYQARLVIRETEAPDVGELLSKVERSKIEQDIRDVSTLRHYTTHSADLQLVKDKIATALGAAPLTLVKQSFTYENYLAHNFIGKLEGATRAQEVFVLGAHFDGDVESPAADDNATGVAGLLAAARILSDYQFESSIHFVSFDLEEIDFNGSVAYLREGGVSEAEKVQGMINLDMIGYYSDQPGSQPFPPELKGLFPDAYAQVENDGFKGNFILNTANESSAALSRVFNQQAKQYVPDLNVVSLVVPQDGKFAPGAFRASDHVTFWDMKYPALSIGDTGGVRNPYYHTPEDAYQTINYDFVLHVVQATIATLAAKAGIMVGDVEVCPIKL